MSWTILTVLVVFACFLCAFALSEWLVRRNDRPSGDGGDPSPGKLPGRRSTGPSGKRLSRFAKQR